ncbi:DNA damage-binding protein 2 isoform X2 [Strongylocentrotus purpuratus]|uniref:DNA damage-binding protein 2 n=1 Tax=Strongylocentrotus purpuratus TaxID=7668 RepID=A0A7M7SX03_STRPU|nr:DNA damage-binding protein 2 isoform X2 [Strongylocentrotus purpuratus]
MAPTSSRNKKDKTAGSASEEKVTKSGKRTTRAAAAVSGRRTRQQRKKVGETDSDTEDFEDQIIKSGRSTTADRQRNRSTPDATTSSNLSNGAVKKQKLDVEEKENEEAIIIRGSRESVSPSITPMDLLSSNIVHRIFRHTTGQRFKQSLRQATIQPFVQQLSEFRVSHGASPFERRVTALEWHPKHPTMLAVGSKGGDLMLWDYSKGQDGWNVVQGIGPGGNIASLLFSRDKPDEIYSASLDGQVRLQNFEGKTLHLFQNTMDWSHWYCSVDINYTDSVLTAGDNNGNVVLMSRQGEEMWKYRLHKQKVTHCEFNRRCPWLLATASTDKTVKMWDIRNVSSKTSYIYQMNHERPINSAYFSPDGTKLLTTDQHSHLRIYSGPMWDTLERTIIHPHRFFQHLTPIKATWHPFQNLIVVGRYPDATLEGFEHDTVRSIDAYDVSSGELVCRLMDQCATGIQSLNVFNPSGDALATGMGLNTLIWQNADIRSQVREEQREIMRRQGKDPPPDEGPSKKKAPKRHRSNNQKLTQKLQVMKKAKNSR